MTTILHIKSSSNLDKAVTRQIGKVVEEHIASEDSKIIERDLVKQVVPHIGPEFLGALASGDPQNEKLALSNQLVDELMQSDILIIEAPMYNFTIPSVLKSWIDHIALAGKTFKYTEEGAQGLVTGKRAVLVLGRGGIYSEGPTKVMDFQETYLKAVLGFIGITDIETICIEGVAFGPEQAQAALDMAESQVKLLGRA